MVKKYFIFTAILFLFSFTELKAQSKFRFLNNNTKEISFRFKLINNLIVIPVNVNGKPLSFILDTGVDKTILFNLSQNDSIDLHNINKIKLKGLGSGEAIEALLSKGNSMQVKNYVSNNQNLYVILRDKFDISGRMGVTIHGIIGNQILKDAIVYVNYQTKRITLYNPSNFKYKKCRKCEVFPMEFYRNKPYINAKVQLDTIGTKMTEVKLLIDTGGSESIWLFENTKEEIKTPIKHFNDFLGEGLSGTIYGNKSRIKGLELGRFKFKNPTVSFLDSASTYYARQFKERNGSVGGNILKRFKLWIDYPNKKITLRKNASLRGGFEYNMSGLDVVYNGKVLVMEKDNVSILDSYSNTNSNTSLNHTINLVTNYTYRFKPSYKVKNVLPDSPADKAGILRDDIILSINGIKAHQLTLTELLNMFQARNNKKIRIKIERKDGKQFKYQFRLVRKI